MENNLLDCNNDIENNYDNSGTGSFKSIIFDNSDENDIISEDSDNISTEMMCIQTIKNYIYKSKCVLLTIIFFGTALTTYLIFYFIK
jgi:hypothetical protein